MSTPVIGREGLLRLVEWAERLRARDPEGGGAARTRASSTDDLWALLGQFGLARAPAAAPG